MRNMQDGKTCIEAGYDDIISKEQCQTAFDQLPHPKKTSKTVNGVFGHKINDNIAMVPVVDDDLAFHLQCRACVFAESGHHDL